MLTISNSRLRTIIDHCKRQKPHEACGFLVGSAAPATGAYRAERFIPVSNRSLTPERHFDMEPAEIVRGLYEIRNSGQMLVGLVHSHPQAPPVPSEEDVRTPWYEVPSHWIVSLQSEEAPVVRAYAYVKRPDGSMFCSQMPIDITDDVTTGKNRYTASDG